MTYEYTELYIRVGKKGWRELGSALVDLPADGWELFMAVPIISLTALIPGISGSRTTAIIHYFRRPKPECEKPKGSNLVTSFRSFLPWGPR
jgi:hypothetical protein